MTDNQLIQLFLGLLRTGLNERGLASVSLIAYNQMQQQGTINDPVIYFTKIQDIPYGHMYKNAVFIDDLLVMRFTELQYYESVFQLQALTPSDPSPTALTASDIINTALSILQGDVFVRLLAQQNANVLRVSQVRNPYFVNDVDKFQAIPNFDISFMYERKYEYDVPYTSRVELTVAKV